MTLVGDEWGETQIAERQIRIAVTPVGEVEDADAAAKRAAAEERRAAAARRPLAAATAFGNSSSVIADDELKPASLAVMTASNDDARRRAVREKSAATAASAARVEQYTRWRRAAANTDLSDVARLGFAYRAGPDARGHEVLVLIGARLPPRREGTLDRVLLYVVDLLAQMSTRDYAVVYIHGGVNSENDPPLAWQRQLYGLFEWPHGERLQAIYVVHPTFMLKVGFAFFASFGGDKLQYIDGLKQLFVLFRRDVLHLPELVFQIDTVSHIYIYTYSFSFLTFFFVVVGKFFLTENNRSSMVSFH